MLFFIPRNSFGGLFLVQFSLLLAGVPCWNDLLSASSKSAHGGKRIKRGMYAFLLVATATSMYIDVECNVSMRLALPVGCKGSQHPGPIGAAADPCLADLRAACHGGLNIFQPSFSKDMVEIVAWQTSRSGVVYLFC